LEVTFGSVDNEEFHRAGMQTDSVKRSTVIDYNNQVVLPYLDSLSCFFTTRWEVVKSSGQQCVKPSSSIYRLLQDNDQLVVSRVYDDQIETQLRKLAPFRKNGCTVSILHFNINNLDTELTELNYAMITDEQKKAILASDRYDAYEEAVAVTALKRRFDLLDKNEQTHPADNFVIETVKAGRGVKILWRLAHGVPSNHELLGFRRTGGFYPDQWDENNNGTLVIHSYKSGEVVEFLNENEPNFYTLFLRTPPKGGTTQKYSPVRFQITIGSQEEMEAIKDILEPDKRKKLNDPRDNMSQVINELGLVMEFHEAMDAMEQSLIAKIKGKKLPKEDEEEKIEFVRDTVRLQREKYQP
jgi:hypothetical protein